MSDIQQLHGPEKILNGGNPDNLVILLHGLGSNGEDLMSLTPYWAPDLPNTAFISPNAPFPCDMAPVGYQWFSLQNRDPMQINKGVMSAAPIINHFIDQQLNRFDLGYDRLSLVGFSQGTMMSLYIAPRFKDKIAGVVGYSGALAGVDTLADEMRSKPPFMLIHGDADDVVPPHALPMAVDSLKRVGCDVQSTLTPGLGHSIDMDGLKAGGAFLKRVLG